MFVFSIRYRNEMWLYKGEPPTFLYSPRVVDENHDRRRRTRDEGFTVHDGDGTEANVLRAAGVENAKTVVAATADDDASLLGCQTARTKFGVENVFARVNDSRNVEAFEALSVTAVDSPMATVFALDNEIERPELAYWMHDLGDGHDIKETEVTAEDVTGLSIRELSDAIPGGCLIAEVGQGADAHVPDPDDVPEHGDHVTFLGDRGAVREAVQRFHPHD